MSHNENKKQQQIQYTILVIPQRKYKENKKDNTVMYFLAIKKIKYVFLENKIYTRGCAHKCVKT